MGVDHYYRVREMERALKAIQNCTDDPAIKQLAGMALSYDFKTLDKIWGVVYDWENPSDGNAR